MSARDLVIVSIGGSDHLYKVQFDGLFGKYISPLDSNDGTLSELSILTLKDTEETELTHPKHGYSIGWKLDRTWEVMGAPEVSVRLMEDIKPEDLTASVSPKIKLFYDRFDFGWLINEVVFDESQPINLSARPDGWVQIWFPMDKQGQIWLSRFFRPDEVDTYHKLLQLGEMREMMDSSNLTPDEYYRLRLNPKEDINNLDLEKGDGSLDLMNTRYPGVYALVYTD